MNRRTFLYGLGVGILTSPLAAEAQTPGKVPRVGLYTAPPANREVFVSALRDLGWVDGQNVLVDWRRAVSDEEEPLAKEMEQLPRLGFDAIVLAGPHRIRAAMKVTKTLPIVGFDLVSDPVASGFVKSLARPGMNATGVWLDLPELTGKQLQFLLEAVPALKRVGVLWDDRVGGPQLSAAQSAARAAAISLPAVSVHNIPEVEDALKRLLAVRPQAILVLNAPTIFDAQAKVAEAARRNRVPSISTYSTYPGAGGLLAYGPNFPGLWHQAADYLDRILKGAKPGDLPVERPKKFELVINLKTAKALGLTIPPSLLLRADQVIACPEKGRCD